MTHPARNAIDDRIETTWRSEYSPAAALPQSLVLDLGRQRSVKGLICRPPVALNADAGGQFITDFNVYLSADGNVFEKIATGRWKANGSGKMALWPERTTRYVKIEAAGSSSRFGVAVSELEVIGSQPGGAVQTNAN
jgi:hypothetical protein